MDDEFEDTLTEFFDNTGKDELKDIVSLSDKNTKFGWSDVEDNQDFDITPRTWGELINKNILKEVEDRKYRLEYKSEINKSINNNWLNKEQDEKEQTDSVDLEDLPEVDYDQSSWRTIDKATMLTAIVCMIGFQYSPIRDIIYTVLSLFLNPLNNILPIYAVILIIAIITSFWTISVREYIINVDTSEFKDRINALEGKDEDDNSILTNPDNVDDEKKNELSRLQVEMLKARIRPFGWIMIVTIPAVIWIFTTTTIVGGQGSMVFPLVGEYVWAQGIIGPLRTWIFWYMICSIPMNTLIQKIINFE